MSKAIVQIVKEEKNGKFRTYRYAFPDGVGETGNVSDGYHTFNELYEFRLLYNAALFNEVHLSESQYGGNLKPVKSRKHSYGELVFGGDWFVVSMQLPTGQVTNHYDMKDWDLFKIPEVETAPVWDGHSAQDVAKRLRDFLSSGATEESPNTAYKNN